MYPIQLHKKFILLILLHIAVKVRLTVIIVNAFPPWPEV